MLAGFAERAQVLDWSMPQLRDEPGIAIERGRHPVVEALRDAPFEPNDLLFDGDTRMYVITGPNMGGKSTFMRQNALIVLLACIGSFVPAARATIGPIDRILTRIGAGDDLARGQSTFMVEMSETAYILHHATEQSLVLMDEIGRGTSTYDGLALADAVARQLAATNRSYTLFATHYFELTALAEPGSGIANLHLDAVEHGDALVFMHSVQARAGQSQLRPAGGGARWPAETRVATGARTAGGTGIAGPRCAEPADECAGAGCTAAVRIVRVALGSAGCARRHRPGRALAEAGARGVVPAEVFGLTCWRR